MATKLISTWLIALVCAAIVVPAWAQPKEFPTRAVRVVVPVPPGGSLDVMARPLQARMWRLMADVISITGPPAQHYRRQRARLRSAPDATRCSSHSAFVVNPSAAILRCRSTPNAIRAGLAGRFFAVVLVVHPSVLSKS